MPWRCRGGGRESGCRALENPQQTCGPSACRVHGGSPGTDTADPPGREAEDGRRNRWLQRPALPGHEARRKLSGNRPGAVFPDRPTPGGRVSGHRCRAVSPRRDHSLRIQTEAGCYSWSAIPNNPSTRGETLTSPLMDDSWRLSRQTVVGDTPWCRTSDRSSRSSMKWVK